MDASKELLAVWSGVGFKRKNGTWSCKFVIARCLLVPRDCTIPRAEMEALVAGSNMLWLLHQILSNCVNTFVLAGDAQIPLHWILTDKLKLGLWHRTCSVQVRQGTPLENIYHVTTEANVADIPTRPDKLTLADLRPGSDWEQGRPWMHKELSQLVEQGILTPIRDLTLHTEEKEDFDKGFVCKHSTLDMTNQGFTTTKDQDNTPT